MTFELGPALRQAREARQLAFEEVAADTRIHPRHLAALEGERFESLPGRAYARSFLREYAVYLGLEPAVFVGEYDVRFAPARIAPQPLTAVNRRGRRRSFKGGLVLGAAVIAAAVALVAWKFGGSSQPVRVAAAAAPAPHVVVPVQKPQPKIVRRAPAPTAPKLVVLSASGRCWVSVRDASATGAVLFQGLLDAETTKRFARRPLWIRFGAPWNVSVHLDGKPVALPRSNGPVNVLFTSTAQQA